MLRNPSRTLQPPYPVAPLSPVQCHPFLSLSSPRNSHLAAACATPTQIRPRPRPLLAAGVPATNSADSPTPRRRRATPQRRPDAAQQLRPRLAVEPTNSSTTRDPHNLLHHRPSAFDAISKPSSASSTCVRRLHPHIADVETTTSSRATPCSHYNLAEIPRLLASDPRPLPALSPLSDHPLSSTFSSSWPLARRLQQPRLPPTRATSSSNLNEIRTLPVISPTNQQSLPAPPPQPRAPPTTTASTRSNPRPELLSAARTQTRRRPQPSSHQDLRPTTPTTLSTKPSPTPTRSDPSPRPDPPAPDPMPLSPSTSTHFSLRPSTRPRRREAQVLLLCSPTIRCPAAPLFPPTRVEPVVARRQPAATSTPPRCPRQASTPLVVAAHRPSTRRVVVRVVEIPVAIHRAACDHRYPLVVEPQPVRP